MNKKIIVLIITLCIFTIGCARIKCGDGICQPIEQRRNSCPEDCLNYTNFESQTPSSNDAGINLDIFCKHELPYKVSWKVQEEQPKQYFYKEDREKIYYQSYKLIYPKSYTLNIYDKKTGISKIYYTFDDTTGQKCAYETREGLINFPDEVGSPLFGISGNKITPGSTKDISDYPSFYEDQWGIGWYTRCHQLMCDYAIKKIINGIECYADKLGSACINEEYCFNIYVPPFGGIISDLNSNFQDSVFKTPAGCESWS